MKAIVARIIMSALLTAGVIRSDDPPEEPQPDLQLIRATCYCDTGNPTASGVMPYCGVLSGRREDLGKAAILYSAEMEYIGIFEFRDIGGDPRLKSGTAIDVYRGDMAGCREWIDAYGDYVYIQVIEAEG